MWDNIFFLKMRGLADLVTFFNPWVVPTVLFASFIENEGAKVELCHDSKNVKVPKRVQNSATLNLRKVA